MPTHATLADSAAAHRVEANRHDDVATESFERCGNDGFLSQWGHTMEAERHRLAVEIATYGGTAIFPALFDLDGNLIATKEVETRYGWSWGLLASDDPHGDIIGWFNPSRARDDNRYRANNARTGYYVGSVRACAKAEYCKASVITNVRAIAVRVDGGFSRDVEILDNGR